MSTPLRTAVVTGASQGLGRAIALRLARAGHRVVVNYLASATAAEATVSEIRTAGGAALAVRADVRDSAQVGALVAEATRVFGAPDILVHNATGPQPMKPLEHYTWTDFQDQLDFFVKAPVLLTQAALAAQKRAGWGRIILIGSEVADLGNAQFSAYVAAKAAMVGLTRAWAREFGPWQITVNLVAPGWIPVARHTGTPQAALDHYAQAVPLQRQGVPADVAGAVAFLAAEEAGFITGQCLSVNGGNTF
ncbi:MAG: SDR family oxidoreductase [Opitutaceae bacterium]|nr:SDR family oxidoreductase [Opitutaceae bacterium]